MMRLYSIYDVVTKEYAPPFYQKTDGSAIRSTRAMFDKMSQDSRNDFQLFFVGEFNPELGIINPTPSLIQIDWSKPVDTQLEITQESIKVNPKIIKGGKL